MIFFFFSQKNLRLSQQFSKETDKYYHSVQINKSTQPPKPDFTILSLHKVDVNEKEKKKRTHCHPLTLQS